jgi:hypothetical protein
MRGSVLLQYYFLMRTKMVQTVYQAVISTKYDHFTRLELKNQRYIKQNKLVPLSYLSGLFSFMGIFSLYSGHSVLFQFYKLMDRSDAIPGKLLSLTDTHTLKGLSHEIDFKNFDEIYRTRPKWLVFKFFRDSNDFIVPVKKRTVCQYLLAHRHKINRKHKLFAFF